MKLSHEIKNIIPYSLGLKIGLGAIIGLLIGSKISGLLTGYVRCYYTIGYGARVSVEGLGLINPRAFLLSFCVSIGASLFFTAVIILLRNFPAKLSKTRLQK